MKKVIAFSVALGVNFLLAGTAFAATELSMWYHGAGNPDERKIVLQVIDDFNSSQSDWTIKLEEFPQAAYNDSVTAAALAHKLPDILDMDGPNMPNWAWSGYLQPLAISEDKLTNFLPGAIGKWQGKLYSVGLWDAALAMFARKSVLDENGIRIPTLDKPWTEQELDDALVKLQKSGKFEYPLDLGMNDKGEWYPYAFSPFLESFGGDLVDRATYLTADGALNGDDAIKWGNWWQSLFQRKLAQGTSETPADQQNGFLDGKVALQWSGCWNAVAAYKKFGDDMLFLPAPDFGAGPKIGAASWQFGVSAESKHPDGAAAFIQFAIQDKYLAQFSEVEGLIPATSSAAAMTTNYKPGGPLAVFFDLSKAQATLRPVTPAYVVISPTFVKAAADIADGAKVEDTLDTAADAITADIKKNNGYGFN